MLVSAEIYRGIEFVRISKLPPHQQEKIKDSLKHDQVIKILIGNTLADDCVQYHVYQAWYMQMFPARVTNNTQKPRAPEALALQEK
ncbi:MAG: hypothetical protein KIT62_05955 [Cyclobacteriaceae bacterium]|nr:hypothetical protein [Cyclobacteriaceae bacterium]